MAGIYMYIMYVFFFLLPIYGGKQANEAQFLPIDDPLPVYNMPFCSRDVGDLQGVIRVE